MRISDRAIGYIAMIALVCIIAFVAIGMYNAHHNQSYTAIVDFDELGSLQPEDPVVVRGYNVGSIGKVTWLGDRARVIIKFTEPLVIREGTEFNNVNYALMGQRRLEITLSKKGNVLPEDHIHQGHFEPGVAEALRFIEDVNQQLINVRDVILLVAEGDSTHPSAQDLYEKVMGSVEGILNTTDKSISSIQPKLNQVFSQVKDASGTLIKATEQADSAVSISTKVVNEKIAKAQEVITTLSEGTAKINQVIAEIESSPAMDKLVNSKETFDKFNEVVQKFNDLIAAIDTKGIKMLDENGKPVELFTWKNTNLIGKTAREKARDREKNGERLPD